MPGPKSFTGCDLIEIIIPGSAPLVQIALDCLTSAGAIAAPRGGFTRQAVAHGRIALDQAEAILALTHAPDAEAAQRALTRLQGGLSEELEPLRQRLIYLRALVEAGLDFIEEDDVQAYEPAAVIAVLEDVRSTVLRWRRAAESMGEEPVVCLVGQPNAGKSALFTWLTGAPALVSNIAGTTRDWLEAPWQVQGRRVRLIDTAGWLARAAGLDAEAVAAGRELLAGAAVVIGCDAPDAPLPNDWREACPGVATIHLATKHDLWQDLGQSSPSADMTISAQNKYGEQALEEKIATILGDATHGDERQQRLLSEAAHTVQQLLPQLPGDELLADELRNLAETLGNLIGTTTTDDVLNKIFSSFCIGK